MKHHKNVGVMLLAACLMLACPLVSFAAQNTAGLKIAYIDLQKVMGLSEAGKNHANFWKKSDQIWVRKLKIAKCNLIRKKPTLNARA